MPSCRRCNGEYGKLEEDLLYRMSLCLSNDEHESLGLGTRLLRALDPTRGRNPKDERIRFRKLQRLLRESHVPDGSRPIVQVSKNSSGQAIPIKVGDLERVGEKIVRGMIFLHLGQIVGPEDEVFCNALPRPEPAFDALVNRFGSVHERGPGIRVEWAKTPEKPIYGAFRITLFGQYQLRGGVLPRNYHQP